MLSLARGIGQRLGINDNPNIRRLYRMAIRTTVQLRLRMLNLPIVAITGTNGKTTITRLVARLLRDSGYNVGACTTEGVTYNGQLVWRGDASWVYGILKAIRCPELDVLVLETARGGLIQYGTGFRRCHVGIVSNVYPDHLGLDGINTTDQLAKVKAIVAERVHRRGAVVLNADNPYTRSMASRSRATPIYFTTGEDITHYDRLFFMHGRRIFKRIDHVATFIMDADESPITFGNLVTYNTENVLAALACMEGLQPFLPLDWSLIGDSIKTFGSNPEDNFNRFIILNYKGDQVILTRCKNPESCRRDMRIVGQLRRKEGFDHVVGIMSGVGNRQERFHEEMAAIASAACDYFFIRPPQPKYLRGKTDEELVRLVTASIPKERIISTLQGGLEKVIALSREKLNGRILFVVLNIYIEQEIHFRSALQGADSVGLAL
jgi:cyanophycin synthetase